MVKIQGFFGTEDCAAQQHGAATKGDEMGVNKSLHGDLGGDGEMLALRALTHPPNSYPMTYCVID